MHGQRQFYFFENRRHSPGPLPDAVGKLNPQVGPENRQQHPWHTPARSDIEHPLPSGQMGADRHRIGHIARHEFFDVCMPGEVEPLVPLPEARGICRQPDCHLGGNHQRQPGALSAYRLGKRLRCVRLYHWNGLSLEFT